MNKARPIFPLLFLIIACEAFTNENDHVNHYWFDDNLVIENGFSEPIYYAVFDQELLAVIDWGPVSTMENRIDPDNLLKLSKDDIAGFQEGKTVVLFYWTEIEPPMDITSVKIDPN